MGATAGERQVKKVEAAILRKKHKRGLQIPDGELEEVRQSNN